MTATEDWSDPSYGIRRTSLISQLKENRLPLEAMIERNLKGRYKNSIIGTVWNLLMPVFLTLAIWLVFSEIKLYSQIENYWFYLAIGMFTMTAMNNSIKGRSFYNNMNYIKKTSVPRWIAVLADALTQLIILVISYVLLMIVALIAGIQLGIIAILFLPIELVLIFVMSLGCSFFFSTLNVLYNDIGHIMSIISRIAVWLTPVFFSLDSAGPVLKTVASYNPFTYFIETLHQSVCYSSIPDPGVLWGASILAIAFLCLGWALFKRYEMELAEMI
ncbi:MAG: ABC transporter permease [Candidatus Methanomethylophilaceae archaeon]|nr:ABC transporter permease [Candidatus Methanomethylophilaceae archaeon]